MENLTQDDFERMKSEAAERLKKMTRRDMPPFPSFVRIPENPSGQKQEQSHEKVSDGMSATDKQKTRSANTLLKYLNIPEMLKNSDAMLLLALILLLSNEDADETLILALAYILL